MSYKYPKYKNLKSCLPSNKAINSQVLTIRQPIQKTMRCLGFPVLQTFLNGYGSCTLGNLCGSTIYARATVATGKLMVAEAENAAGLNPTLAAACQVEWRERGREHQPSCGPRSASSRRAPSPPLPPSLHLGRVSPRRLNPNPQPMAGITFL